MFRRKLLRSVCRSSKFCLDVRIAYYSNCLDGIKMRAAAPTAAQTSPGDFKLGSESKLAAETKTTAASISVTECNGNVLPLDQRQPTFEELVFYPNGRETSIYEIDANSIARTNDAYNAAVNALTTLQPNATSIRNSISNAKADSLVKTIKYLERSGLSLTTVEQLSTIHVAGTKGKGSTCALTESILRQYGARTGFFSSPHLLSTNERIRINGVPLEKHKFTQYFWLVYNRLMEQREYETDMPPFFMFLTILGFHVFIAKQVDVVVLEVGIGGELDCTNILRNVRTAGITSLGLEHTALLGKTLKEIAWQKAGIIKSGAHVYTHVTQPECLEVIYARAAERKANVIEVQNTEAYFENNLYSDYLDSFNAYVRLNGALAIQLAYDWLRQTDGPLHQDYTVNESKLSNEVLRGLANAHWPGRCQLVNYEMMRLHLDGAHTVESINVCTEWFRKSTCLSVRNPKILVFNRTGDSDISAILEVLQQCCFFDMICFVPNLASGKPNDINLISLSSSAEMQKKRAQDIANTWQQLCDSRKKPNQGQMYESLFDAFTAMRQRYLADVELDVLVTGSIHLLGATIAALNDFHATPIE